MKKLLLPICVLIILASATKLNAQYYYEWAHELPFRLSGRQIADMSVDSVGNVYTAGVNQSCPTCYELFVLKEDKNGNTVYNYTVSPSAGPVTVSSVTCDRAGNVYISASKSGGTILIGTTMVSSDNFIFKLTSSGSVSWIIQNEIGYIVADTAGALYVTNNSYTKKYNKNGVFKWQFRTLANVVGIGVDKGGKCFIANTDSILKINFAGTNTIYAKNYGGNKMAINNNGIAYLLTSSSLTKVGSNGTIAWSLPVTGGSAVAVDKNSAPYIVANNSSIIKYNGSGLMIGWTKTSVNAPFLKVGVDSSKRVYACGNYNTALFATLCPFKLADKNGDVYSTSQSFTTKITNAAPYPFQAGIYTADFTNSSFAGNNICKNVLFQVPYNYCLSDSSAFGPTNEFRAQISNDNFVTFTDIGKADSAIIPSLFASGSGYRIRIVTTDPAVNGYPNYSINSSPGLTVQDNDAVISAAGATTFCSGDYVQLNATLQPNTTVVDWYNGSTFLGNSNSVIATTSGTYTAVFHNANCQAVSNSIVVTVNSRTPVTISSGGPLNFCAGGSVTLTANPSIGLTYQWRRNAVDIAGETNANYVAITAGTYSVKTVNGSGCLKVSAGVVVTVPCRTIGEETSSIEVFPNPFNNSLTLNVSNQDTYSIELKNILGQTVYKNKLENFAGTQLFDFHSLVKGMYFLEIKSPTENKLVKVIKN